MLNMLKILAEKQQVNIVLRKSDENKYVFGIAPQGADEKEFKPLICQGTVDEIKQQLNEKHQNYIKEFDEKIIVPPKPSPTPGAMTISKVRTQKSKKDNRQLCFKF